MRPEAESRLAFALDGIFGRLQSVIQQHANGHRTDTARNGSDGGSPFLGSLEFNVTGEFAAGQPIDADIDDHGSRLDPIASHQPGFTDSDDQNIRPAHFVPQAGGARMSDCHGGMLFKQHQSYRFADDVAAADNDSVFTFGRASRRL